MNVPFRIWRPRSIPAGGVVLAVVPCLAVWWPVAAAPADLRVPQDHPTIQQAIDAADGAAGDVVLVSCGTYAEALSIERGKAGITVRSTTGDPRCVTIDAQGKGRVLYSLSPVTMEGLTLTGGQGELFGGGAFLSQEAAGTSIVGCVIRGNAARTGGGVYSVESVTLEDCLVVSNFAESGAGFGGFGPASISRCTFSSNVATDRGGAIYGGTGFDAVVSASTLHANRASEGSAISLRQDARVRVEQTLIAFGDGDAVRCYESARVDVVCSDIFGNAGGDWVDLGSAACLADQLERDGNLSADPKFCTTSPGDTGPWDLQSDSPCLPSQSSCGLIGAWGVGCAVSTERTTWGGVKGRY